MNVAGPQGIGHAVHMPGRGSTIRSRRLGQRLRSLRERTGLTPEEAASRLGWSRPKLVRFETATQVPKAGDVTALCELYGAASDERALVTQLASEAGKRGWWTAYGDVFTGSYVADEAEAAHIRTWQPLLIPGLLQTEQYAWAVIQAGRADSPDDAQRRVMARMARRTLLSRPDAPQLDALIDEAALRRPVGGPDVMCEQLRELLRPRPNVSIRIVPFRAGVHPGLEGGFVLLDFPPDTSFPTEVYAESIAGDLYPESTDQIARISLAYERIGQAALTPDESATLIRQIIEELSST
jgi:transcriptional regulator with XRE-family HTH domain